MSEEGIRVTMMDAWTPCWRESAMTCCVMCDGALIKREQCKNQKLRIKRESIICNKKLLVRCNMQTQQNKDADRERDEEAPSAKRLTWG